MTENERDHSSTSSASEQPRESSQSSIPKDVPLPEPSLIGLVSGLASQAMISMGIFPNPVTGGMNMLLNQARHLIETISMLEIKTKGNRTEEETDTIENVLHELRMLFVAAQNEMQRRNQEGTEKTENV